MVSEPQRGLIFFFFYSFPSSVPSFIFDDFFLKLFRLTLSLFNRSICQQVPLVETIPTPLISAHSNVPRVVTHRLKLWLSSSTCLLFQRLKTSQNSRWFFIRSPNYFSQTNMSFMPKQHVVPPKRYVASYKSNHFSRGQNDTSFPSPTKPLTDSAHLWPPG